MQLRPSVCHAQRIVIKLGSATVVGENDLNTDFLDNLASQIKALRDQGKEILIVTSGAVSMGHHYLSWPVPLGRLSLPEKQALAAVGQSILLQKYREIFAPYQINIGQILLSALDIHQRSSYLHLRNVIESLLSMEIIPIINENDSVAIRELLFGDNDTLAANTAILAQADLLIIYSDVAGFLIDNKRQSWISKVDGHILSLCGSKTNARGTGGMITKVKAANLMMRGGKMAIVTSFRQTNSLQAIMANEDIGTLFVDPAKKDKWRGRRRWIALNNKVQGSIYVDQGASQQISKKGKSLLAKGIVAIKGNFAMGDLVEIIDEQGIIGQGLCHFSSVELDKIRGKHSSEFSTILRKETFQTVVHRNNFVAIDRNLEGS